MGNNRSFSANKPFSSDLPKKLTKNDYDFLTYTTRSQKCEIDKVFKEFMTNNPDGKLNRNEFIKLYNKLKPEPAEFLNEISNYVFKSLDTDHNDCISFNEFLVAYSLTSRGDLKQRLNYAFELYDLDENGYIDENELKIVLEGMLNMLGTDKKLVPGLVMLAMKELDTSRDGKVSKDEFVKGLLAQPSLRAIMNPFD